jgi:hypothetical protein
MGMHGKIETTRQIRGLATAVEWQKQKTTICKNIITLFNTHTFSPVDQEEKTVFWVDHILGKEFGGQGDEVRPYSSHR